MPKLIKVTHELFQRGEEECCSLKGKIQLEGKEGAWEIPLDERDAKTIDTIVRAVFPATDDQGEEMPATPPKGRKQRREFWQKRAKAAGIINKTDQERSARELLLAKINEDVRLLCLETIEPTRATLAADFDYDPRFGSVGFNRRLGSIKFDLVFTKKAE